MFVFFSFFEVFCVFEVVNKFKVRFVDVLDFEGNYCYEEDYYICDYFEVFLSLVEVEVVGVDGCENS